MRVFGSFGRSLLLADAALCAGAYVRPANIDDDELHTHKYRAPRVKLVRETSVDSYGESSLTPYHWSSHSIAAIKCIRSLSFAHSHWFPTLSLKAAQPPYPTPQLEPLNACEIPEILCSCQNVVALGSLFIISKREMHSPTPMY